MSVVTVWVDDAFYPDVSSQRLFFNFSLFSCDSFGKKEQKGLYLCFCDETGTCLICLRAGGQFSQQAAVEADKRSGEHDGKSAAAAHLAASVWIQRVIPALASRSLFVWSLPLCL